MLNKKSFLSLALSVSAITGFQQAYANGHIECKNNSRCELYFNNTKMCTAYLIGSLSGKDIPDSNIESTGNTDGLMYG